MNLERFSKSFPGKVWNILLNTANSWLVMEVRDHTAKKVSFWILDLQSFEWVWEDVGFEESWWLNLLASEEGNVYFNYFPDDKNPESKKIIVVDVRRLEVVGEVDVFVPSKKNNNVQVPLHYVEGSEHFETVKKFVAERYNHDIVKTVDYLETERKVFISYYIYEGEKMDNFLLIMDDQGSERVHEIIGKELETVGMATFFAYGNLLITVKNKQELLLYQC